MSTSTAIITTIEAALAPLAHPDRAVAMAAYMKNHFPFLGIPTPERRDAMKAVAKPALDNVPAIVRALWQKREREFHYAALDILEAQARKLEPVATLTLIEELTLQNTWWDSVDAFAGIASSILRRNPPLRPVVERWSAHQSFWINRLAILHQNGWGKDTDEATLLALCLAHADNDEFFIRKAIGWALRDYAWVNSAAVQAFVAENEGRLSTLSVREALKNVGRVRGGRG